MFSKMEIKKELFVFVLIGLSAYVLSDQCPSKENLTVFCECHKESDGTLETKCLGQNSGQPIEDFRKMLEDNFSGKRNINLIFKTFTKETRLPSRMFEGLHITRLEIEGSNVSRWAEEEGWPAFVGLEDSLEVLRISSSIIRLRAHERYEDEKAPMTFALLNKLRELYMSLNYIYNFGNDWFGSGANSVEILHLKLNNIFEIGDRAFASLTNLKEIKLDSNQILTVSRSMFPRPAEHLEEIGLMDNKLRALPEDMFANMPKIARIDLTGNEITRLAESTWRPIWSNLEYLMFDHNPLFCNDHINWIYEVRPPAHLDARCASPREVARKSLTELIQEKEREKQRDAGGCRK